MLENSEKFPETRAQGNIFKTLFFLLNQLSKTRRYSIYKSSKSSNLRAWNHRLFGIIAW